MFKVGAHPVLESIICLATKYYHCKAASMPFHAPESWDSHAISIAIQRILFISWEPSPLGFMKVNIDGNISSASGGAGYVIQDPNINFCQQGALDYLGLAFQKPSSKQPRQV